MPDVINQNQQFASPQEALEHFGVPGMRWGHRKTDSAPAQTYSPTVDVAALKSPITHMDPIIHTETQDAAHQVAGMLSQRYGYDVTSVRAVPQTKQFKNYIAYVESNPDAKNGAGKGTIFVQPRAMNAEMKKEEGSGWFGRDQGNMRAVMTHETAHSMFHAEEKFVKTGFLKGKWEGGEKAAREKAWIEAEAAAIADGIKKNQVRSKISGYANYSMWHEETEAELFSQYHWMKDPPRFVQVWGETLHNEMGIDPTPFREVVDNG